MAASAHAKVCAVFAQKRRSNHLSSGYFSWLFYTFFFELVTKLSKSIGRKRVRIILRMRFAVQNRAPWSVSSLFGQRCVPFYHRYLVFLNNKRLKPTKIKFYLDNNNAVSWKCGPIPEVYATIDFGIDADVNDAFGKMRKATPVGPLVV